MDAEEQQSTSTEEETEDMLSCLYKSDVGERLSTTMSSSMKDIGPFKQSTFVQMPKSMTDFTSDLSDNEHNERGIPVRYKQLLIEDQPLLMLCQLRVRHPVQVLILVR